jgi:hypothetical protein
LLLNKANEDILYSAAFLVRNGRRSFFASILSHSRPFIRLDMGCMRATCDDGAAALATFDKKNWQNQIERVHWAKGDVVILDNWRILHGRAGNNEVDESRTIYRVSIK